MARWALVLALVWAWWAPAQLMEPPHCAAAVRCAAAGSSQSEYIYIVDGFTVYLEYTDSGYFKLKCTAGLRLDNSALPTFESQLRVNKVYFEDCPSPQSSYADVLERFNVVVLEKMTLTKIGNLTATHFTQLQHLHKLELLTAALAPGALSALSQLQYLLLDSVRTAPGELRRLPASLETLSLMRMGMDVTAADLAALPRLDYLVVRDPANVRVDASAAPRMLSLDLPAAVLARELSPSLRKLTVFGWGEAHPAPWLQCALESLDLRDALAEELPPGWLARCSALRSLRVDSAARLVRLEPGALRGAVELQELRVVSTALQYLPPGLLDDLPQLKLLDLSSNRLLELPGGLFARTNSLESLNLSSNQLTQGVLSSLSAVTSLVSLDLSNNNLKDSCGSKSDAVRGSSPLQYLKLLRKLVLKNTNISMICRDWRENMPQLKTLDLTDNLFEYITFADMQFYGTTNVSVDLQRNNVSVLEYTREDYKSAVDLAKPELRAHLLLSSRLRCDCHVYWAARAFHERPQHARLTAQCADGSPLARAPAALECAGAPPGVRCAAPCACAWRPGERAVLRVRCEGAALRSARALRTAVAAPRGLAVDWELYLANNSIERVELDDLPPNVTVLDLRNNSVSSLSVRTARELVQRGLRLAGNPLHCGCGAADVLAVLRARLADLPRATCRDGAPLAGARPAACAAWPAPALGAAAALATLLLGAALLAALWRRPGLRLRLKAALHRRGWLPAQPEPDYDARRFDVFVSFSHGDEHFVRSQLVARLESGPAPYRLCLHYRDWAPGGWIPAQIAASVRASRRTVAVVSEHFLRSSWARAEFQEAHALALRSARPRLVVVLLEEPARLPLDGRLRRYLAANTYVRWGDPWFWEKLYLALPRGRCPAPAGGPAAPPATTLASGAPPTLGKSDALDGDESTLVPLTPAPA